MTQPYVTYVAAAGQRDFDVPFPYINRSHVKVRVNGTPVVPFSWPSATRLRLPAGVAGGAAIEIERETPVEEQLVKFQDGNILTSEDLNIAVQQLLYKQQEVTGLYDRSLRAAQVRVGDSLGIVTNPEDVAQELAELVLENQVLDTFRARISDIDLNANSILSQSLALNDLTSVVDTLLGGDPGTGIATLIQQEQTERIAGDAALASTLSLIGARSGDNLSFILDTNSVRVSPTESMAQRFSALVAQDGTNTAAIQSEQNARVAADAALTTSLNTLGTRVGAAEAAIVAEQTARASGDAAEASARQALAARVTTAEQDINAAEAAITAEQTARANGDGALSSSLNALTARVTSTEGGLSAAQADILAEQTARAAGDGANATAISGLSARMTTAEGDINAAEAAIVTEQNARVSADSALASSISTLSTTVGGNTAAVSTLQSSVNGLQARYGVSLDVNGYVTGFVQNNNGVSGDFTVIADRFAIVTPGAAPTVPFEVSGGVVRIKQAAIGNLDVERLNSGALNAEITQNGDWRVGTGRIIWDNGTHMKVAGVGFGSTGQFIEWFGPKMDIGLCSEANAISYLKTNGDAYFGGSLSAGILKNSAQTTDIGASASVTVGPFGTNGNPIQVLTGYSAESQNIATYPATSQGVTNWSNAVSAWGATPQGSLGARAVDATKAISCNVVVLVERTVSGSTNSGWVALTITGGTERLEGYEPVPGDGTPGELLYTRVVSGTITSTDNAGGTADRTFTATITTRTNATLGTILRQSVSVLATEE